MHTARSLSVSPIMFCSGGTGPGGGCLSGPEGSLPGPGRCLPGSSGLPAWSWGMSGPGEGYLPGPGGCGIPACIEEDPPFPR